MTKNDEEELLKSIRSQQESDEQDEQLLQEILGIYDYGFGLFEDE